MNSHVGDVDAVATGRHCRCDGPFMAPGLPIRIHCPRRSLANISTRGAGRHRRQCAFIGGFIIQGSEPATVILRAIGFSLAASGCTDALSDPTITVYDSNQREVATNERLGRLPAQPRRTISSYHLDPPNSRESALYLTLEPGAYTAIVQSYVRRLADTTDERRGIIRTLRRCLTTGGRAGNVSTSRPGAGGRQSLLIGGFIVGGTESRSGCGPRDWAIVRRRGRAQSTLSNPSP